MAIRLYPYLVLLSIVYVGLSCIPLMEVFAEPNYVSMVNRFVGIIALTSCISGYYGFTVLEARYNLMTQGYANVFLRCNRSERVVYILSLAYNFLLGLMFNFMAAPRLAMMDAGIPF